MHYMTVTSRISIKCSLFSFCSRKSITWTILRNTQKYNFIHVNTQELYIPGLDIFTYSGTAQQQRVSNQCAKCYSLCTVARPLELHFPPFECTHAMRNSWDHACIFFKHELEKYAQCPLPLRNAKLWCESSCSLVYTFGPPLHTYEVSLYSTNPTSQSSLAQHYLTGYLSLPPLSMVLFVYINGPSLLSTQWQLAVVQYRRRHVVQSQKVCKHM